MQEYLAIKRTLVTAPTTEPLTTAEAKLWLGISSSTHDAMVDGLVAAARTWIETNFDVCLITQTWDISLDDFPVTNYPENPDGSIELGIYPVQSITHVKYLDTVDGTQQTWTASNYTLEKPLNMPARILRAYDVSWPDVRDIQNAVTIRAVCGYGAASAVPETIKTSMKLLIKMWYDNPEDMRLSGAPWERSARALLNNLVIWRL